MLKLKGQKVVVMGLGLHGGGLAVTRWLADSGADVLVTDLKRQTELQPSLNHLKKYKKIKYVLGRHREADFKNCDMVIRNPGVPADSKFIKLAAHQGAVIHNEASLFFSLISRKKIIGVTGTRGKSSTAALLGYILKKQGYQAVVAGNIGTSAMFDVMPQAKQADFIVLELSSWHLENMHEHKQSPHIAVMTNIFPEHLNRYKTLARYKKAKSYILAWQTQKDYAVLNYDNAETKKLGLAVKSQRFWFSQKFIAEQNASFVKSGLIIVRDQGQEVKVAPTSSLPRLSQEKLSNYMAAICVARILNVSSATIRRGVKTFSGLPHRLEFVTQKNKIEYYNDSAASSPEATLVALKTLNHTSQKKIILIAGGSDKKLNFKALAQEIKKSVKAVVLFSGPGAQRLHQALKQAKAPMPIKANRRSMPAALSAARSMAQAGNIVLLSPACASFGLFANEFKRGEEFKAEVKKL